MGDRQGEESPKAIIFTGIQASGKSTFLNSISGPVLYILIWIRCIPGIKRRRY